jgi:hypothetical protein
MQHTHRALARRHAQGDPIVGQTMRPQDADAPTLRPQCGRLDAQPPGSTLLLGNPRSEAWVPLEILRLGPLQNCYWPPGGCQGLTPGLLCYIAQVYVVLEPQDG